jgi:cellulose synthase/poly-beta-1,6-N-acetylglucosamine synthase-like glycosyltransferase
VIAPWHVGVLIPARNEEDLLPQCLNSVLQACRYLPLTTTFDIVVAVDSSTDRTAHLAENLLHGYGAVVHTDAGLVGCARSLAAQALLQRYRGPLDRCWLANTDADCRVPHTWLTKQLQLANDHHEAIAGTVDVDSFAEHTAGVADRFRRSYHIHPDGSHPHVHGANLGIRADAYVRAGGWSALATAEDHDLWERLRLAGARRLSVSSTEVLTSGRRVGRAPFGFADALAAHNRVAS